MGSASTLDGVIPTKSRRTATDVLAWVIDTLDNERRPRREARLVVYDIQRKLEAGELAVAKLAELQSRDPYQSTSLYPVGVPPPSDTAHTPLRSSSVMQGGSGDIADLSRQEEECWHILGLLKRQVKPSQLHIMTIDQLRRLKETKLKFQERNPIPEGMVSKAEVEEFENRIKGVLQAYPEALAAVMEALGNK